MAISYADQVRCPHALNLIAIMGDTTPDDGTDACDGVLCDLQIEGTGAKPLDVLVDNGFSKLNGLRADRADGFYLKGIAFQQAEFNSVYILETDGFAIVDGLARANDEYGYLAFASDHGLFDRVEGYFNGDSAIYPGLRQRHQRRHGLLRGDPVRHRGAQLATCTTTRSATPAPPATASTCTTTTSTTTPPASPPTASSPTTPACRRTTPGSATTGSTTTTATTTRST